MQPRFQYQQLFEPLTVPAPAPVPDQWWPVYPPMVRAGGLQVAQQRAWFYTFVAAGAPPAPDLSWQGVYPAMARAGGLRAQYHPQPSLDPLPRPALFVQWLPLYPDRALGPKKLLTALQWFTSPDLVPHPPSKAGWTPLYADRVFRVTLGPARMPFATYVPVYVAPTDLPVTLVFWSAGNDTVVRVTDDSTTAVGFEDVSPVIRFTVP